MKIAVLKERWPNETRVAASPETVKKLIGLGAVLVLVVAAWLTADIANSYFDTMKLLGIGIFKELFKKKPAKAQVLTAKAVKPE